MVKRYVRDESIKSIVVKNSTMGKYAKAGHDGYHKDKDGNLVHRVVYKNHHGGIPKKWHVHHIDGCKTNNDISNLIAIPCYAHEMAHNTHRLPSRQEIEGMLSDWQREVASLTDRLKQIEPEYKRITSRLLRLNKVDFSDKKYRKNNKKKRKP